MSYAALVVPRRTRCPPVIRANSVRLNTRVWFDPERALTADTFRKQCPLHYYLSTYDAAAVRAAVEAGVDPGKRDAAGRTVLDLAVEMAFDVLETCFCTSTPVDNINASPTAFLSPAKGSPSEEADGAMLSNPFVAKYKDACSNLYAHSNRMRLEMRENTNGVGAPKQLKSLSFYLPKDAEEFSKKRYVPAFKPQGYYGERQAGADAPQEFPSFPLPEGDVTNGDTRSHRIRPQQFLYAFDEHGQPSAWKQLETIQTRLEQRHLQHSFLVILDDFLRRPPNQAAAAQMRDLVRRLNLLLTVVKKFSASHQLRREAAEKATDFLENLLTYPYLYIATLHQLFRRYPKALNGEPWDVRNPAESRRLVLTVLSLRLSGHELLSFLGTVCRLFSALLTILRVLSTNRGLRAPNSSPGGALGEECSQYYLHMAFTLDDLGLFQMLVLSPRLFERRDIFKWEDLLYTLMQHRERFHDYVAALLAKRLKARVQKRFLADAEARAEYIEETVKYPCEERYLTRQLLDQYSDIFGPAEADEFTAMLRHWRYGAARAVPSREADWQFPAPRLLAGGKST